MYVIKRNKNKTIRKEPVHFDKITRRIQKLLYGGLDATIDPVLITQKICSRIFSGITTTELDNLAAQICMSLVTDHFNFGVLGSRIAISNHQKNTSNKFLDVVEDLNNNRDVHDELSPLLNEEFVEIVRTHHQKIEQMIDYERDYLIDFFGFKTLERSYLLRVNVDRGKTQRIVERPQHLFMRVAIGLHGTNFERVKKTYDGMSLKKFTMATPTLFNSGGKYQQLSSCFLLATHDSIEGIFQTITDSAKISKFAGGIGIHISNIRSNGAYIRKTGGRADGIMPMLKVYNDVSRYINQGGRRAGSFAMYLEPHHPDIFDFLEAKKPIGAEEKRARDLFYALWISDLFMEKIKNDDDWYLLDPDACPGLTDVYGKDYNLLYNRYVDENKYTKKIKAREIWEAVIASQIETGTPYILYKDSCNLKSNQKNIDTIRSSNLCVSGDTMILTQNGYFPIEELKDKEISVWNGKEWSNTIVKQTGENQKLIEVEFSNGLSLKCTEYHKFYIETGSRPSDKSKPKIIEAKELKKNMKIIRYEVNITNDNNIDIKNPYTQGFFAGDGTYSVPSEDEKRCSYKKIVNTDFCSRHVDRHKKYDIDDDICCAECYSIRPMLSLYGEKKLLTNYIVYDFKGNYLEKEDKITLSLPFDLKDKFYVPINNSLDSKVRWLEGYLDSDGTVLINNRIKNIQVTSVEKKFLINVLYLLQTIGITSSIGIGRNERKTLLPDGKGDKKYYNCQKLYRLGIDSIGLDKLIKLGFSPKRLNINDSRLPHHKTNMFIKVKNIIDDNEYGDTFCFNEPKEHKGIFNGILTGQCAEILEVSNQNETAVCNLASICLPSILESPNIKDIQQHINWKSLLTKDQQKLVNYYFNGKLKLYSTEDCVYCKLLKGLLKDVGLEYEEISEEQAEKYRIMSNASTKPFETVPQLFGILNDDIQHLGGYTDSWNILSPKINYKKLVDLAYDVVINLNSVIDKNYYPIEKFKTSNTNHRPVGLGVNGLADVYMILKIQFDSEEARKINKEIFESMYYGAIKSSHDLALKEGKYSTFEGSPLSQGLFQFNLWGLKDENLSGKYDWKSMREKVMENGVRNSLLIALMPTASSASIYGYNEAFEAITSNLYNRRTLGGEFLMVNKYLTKDLINLDLWDDKTRDRLMFDKGSVQKVLGLPKFLKDVYKIVYEISQKSIIEMAADRAPFVCQSQSMNLFFDKVDFKTLNAAHFLGWKLGLKTGSYYIRTKASTSAQNFAISATREKEMQIEDQKIEEETGCLSCGA